MADPARRRATYEDLAGWRLERMPIITNETPYFTLSPDWACEVLSPSTAKLDRAKKLPLYARERVGHVWLVDPALRTLIELDLAVLWAGVEPA